MRTIVIILIAALFGFAAPSLASADHGHYGQDRSYATHYEHDRGRHVQRVENHPCGYDFGRRYHRHMRHQPRRHGHDRRPAVRVIYRDRVAFVPGFSFFLRIR